MKNHAKISTVLWHPSYDVEKDLKKKQDNQVHVIWVETYEQKVVPATVLKEPECIEHFHKFLTNLGYKEYGPAVPVAEDLQGDLSNLNSLRLPLGVGLWQRPEE